MIYMDYGAKEIMKKRIISIIALISLMISMGSALNVSAASKYVDTSDYTALCELYKDYFRIGVAVQAIDHWNDPTAEIGNPDKEALIERCFNSMTFGNELKPAYNFDPESKTLFTVDPAAEELLAWAKEHGMPVRGHTLVWHSQVNPAIFAKDFKALSNGKVTTSWEDKLDDDCLVSRDELIDRLRTYIYGAIEYTYANGYGDVIYAWDVVNEAVEEKAPQGLRESYWKKIIGPEYLYYCFLFAREACVKYSRQYADLYDIEGLSDADLEPIMPELFYNDYNEWFPARIRITKRFISEDEFNPDQSMIKSDVIAKDGDGTILGDGLIDGIGMQGHIESTQNIEQYVKALEAYDECTGNVHITELDVAINGKGAAAYYKQAKFYYDFFTALMDEVDKGIALNCVTFWGLTDDASWKRGKDPLLFRGDLSGKSAYDAVVMVGKREAFTIEESSAVAASADLAIDFEPDPEKAGNIVNLEELGFTSRGSGHESRLMLMTVENHTEGVSPGYALKVSRPEQDASVKLDLSGFAGKPVKIGAFVKTDDKMITMGIEGDESVVLCEAASDKEWTGFQGTCMIPDGSAASLYIETDGTSDMFIDDITVSVIDKSEVEGTGGNADEQTLTDEAESQDTGAGDRDKDGTVSEAETVNVDTDILSRVLQFIFSIFKNN